ncbi:PhzF family phenazine biosynthesis protein [Natronosporangium hydrolyticum]|uniref:PhzF family phenazine biosynthesis protein n=1 Tax=Natronosporangium hydrolyticum TaxID=2811111 RepID=A0A895YMA4_9ACTN|nr:PhzF family phenazine biosynthesis protein [Natronosporangium hydrolyticum]QSB15230.1 PhzF family phenazine biosynthesis protein [Natronosporangium hydrolyticum]
MRRRFQQVDVFGSEPFAGNPVAVVLDGDGLSTEQMQSFTRWTNLSEATFVLPPTTPGADYRVRIFTLSGELPFAGHPTLGTCHAWLAAGGSPREPETVVQECGVGLVSIRRDAGSLAFAAPPLRRSGPVDPALTGQLAAVLGIDVAEIVAAEWVDNGPGWVGVLLADAESVLRLQPDFRRYDGDEKLHVGVVGPYPAGAECAFELRALLGGAQGQMIEDPVTGSLNASVAQWLLGSGRASAPYVASQGTRLARRGRVWVDRDEDGTVWVGGATVSPIVGEIEFPA